MDSIIHAALEEICSQASNGLYLSHLWPKLLPSFSAAGLQPCNSVKRAFWSNLLKISGIQFIAGDVSFVQSDSRIQSFEECEKLNLKIVAGENLRDCFLGLYDSKALNSNQRPVLERLGAARENGVTQEQLSKELGIQGNNFFYVVKSLESRGLVVRQSTIVRKKEPLSAASCCSPVTTNLICLHRYAFPLGSQQRLEITKENKNLTNDVRESVNSADVIFGECGQDDVLVKDFLPAMKAICERLEQADGKVLVVSDIKRDLGYQKTQGHRAWRNICGRLKDAGVVEIFDAKVDGKVSATTSLKSNKAVSCLRLVKKFSPKLFEPKTLEIGYDGAEAEQLITLGRKGQITEQLVELPIEQQMFDMIDAEGSKGLIVFEVWKRLGINSKRNHNRLNVMTSRFGLVQLPENHKRVTAYRVWTPRNFGLESSNFFLGKPGNLLNEKENHAAAAAADSNCETSCTPDLDFATLDHDFVTTRSTEKRDTQQDLSCHIPENGKYDQRLLCPSSLQGSLSHMRITVPDPNFSVVGTTEFNASSVETSSHRLSKSLSSQPRQRYPSLTSAQREKRILERLKKEKIILKCELHRWLDSLENGQRKMDRKTLLRCLKKLEEDGSCKLILYSVPGVTNYGRHREVPVVLHPSFKAHDLSDQVLDRLRSFEMKTRGQGSSRLKNDKSVPLLNDIQRIQIKSNSEAQSIKSEAMRANGFVLAKMSRTRLLHNFLWGYVNISSGNKEALPLGEHFYLSKNPHSTCKLFALDAAIKAIPLELFLQVVGCSHKLEGMVEKCKSGLLLSDLPKEEYKCMMNTQATARLSWLIDILQRLKLIRLVADESLKEGAEITHATLTHALELKPYIEEPPLGVSLSLDSGSHDLRPHLRHDFVLSTREAVEKYWQTLEYCYAASDAKAALHAFPGSSVREADVTVNLLEFCAFYFTSPPFVGKAELNKSSFQFSVEQPRASFLMLIFPTIFAFEVIHTVSIEFAKYIPIKLYFPPV
ncbi:hypothetical protein Nepgr_019991 [Nepenthes gracilis]|uniref:B-block binding subunit of TFIIIC domain-containing protein n=1 Tax=Nepenthes gracilis TaxID=150966 RepID=A0AAD3XVQ8_NEPGR|nr:hypothetical protein Nepgr_019991 [Nepenthes gracilis]